MGRNKLLPNPYLTYQAIQIPDVLQIYMKTWKTTAKNENNSIYLNYLENRV